MSETCTANAVRAPFTFSEAIAPLRAMVVSSAGNPLGLGHIIARHTLRGKLMSYVVALDCGERITVLHSEVFSPDHIITPPPTFWRSARNTTSYNPKGAA
jgi:hypothetical protein